MAVQLSKILNEIDGSIYSLELGYAIFYDVCYYFTETSKSADRRILEGLSPERIFLDDDWKDELKTISLDNPQPPFEALAYYPPWYASGQSEWDDSCSVFALCAILYRIHSNILPYVDDPDEDVPERVENLTGERKYPLFLKCFRDRSLQNFLSKGLSLDKESRYQTLEEAFEDFKKIPLNKILYNESDSPIFQKQFYEKAEASRQLGRRTKNSV